MDDQTFNEKEVADLLLIFPYMSEDLILDEYCNLRSQYSTFSEFIGMVALKHKNLALDQPFVQDEVPVP